MTNLTKFLDEVEQRLGKATPGPWSVASDLPNYAIVNMEKTDGGTWIKRVVVATENHTGKPWVGDTYGCGSAEDAKLIAHAPDDLKILLAIVKKQREALKEIYNCDGNPVDTARTCIADCDRIVGGGK